MADIRIIDDGKNKTAINMDWVHKIELDGKMLVFTSPFPEGKAYIQSYATEDQAMSAFYKFTRHGMI